MILGRSSKPRSRASIACAGCRARRTKCIIGEGQSACDRCIRLSKTCVLRDDDERKRPVTKSQVHALVRRIGALEQRLSDAGLEIPPTLAEDVAAARQEQQQQQQQDEDNPRQRRTSMREDVAAAVQGSVVTAAALVAAATGQGRGAQCRGAAQAAGLRGEGGRDIDSLSPPPQQQQYRHDYQAHGPSGTTPSSGDGGAGSMWPPPPMQSLGQALDHRDRGRSGHGVNGANGTTSGSISGTSANGNGNGNVNGNGTVVSGGAGPGSNGVMLMDETDASPTSTAASSSDMASSSAMYASESEQRRRLLRAGSMSLGGPGGHSRYIGITTNYHIYSNMYHAEKEETRRERENNAARTRALLANIPYEAHQHLINQFWSCYNTIIHIIPRKAFELDSGMARGDGNTNTVPGMGSSPGSGSYYSPFLHVCMLAVGYRYADRTKPDIQAFATPEGESLLHEEAKRLVDHELQMPGGIPSLQALLLLGDLECGVGRYNTGWLYAGMACRLIFDLGLNRQCGQAGQSKLDMDVKRTVLWGCVVLDRFWGLFLGRPTSIKIADISISNNSDNSTTQSRRPMQGCLPMGAQCRLDTEIYEALIGLTDTASKLTDAAHRHYATSDPSAYYFVTGLHRELRSWHKQLSSRLQWTPANLARNPPSAFFNLHQQYHTMFILLYRPFLSAGKPTPVGTHNAGGGQTNGNPEAVPYRKGGGRRRRRTNSYSPHEDGEEERDDEDNEDNDENDENDEDGNDSDDNDDGIDDPELGTDIVTEIARKMCFVHAIEVARIYEAFCARFPCRSMFVTGMQHAATAAFAIVEGLATQQSGGGGGSSGGGATAKKQAETLLHLQRLAESLYAHASVYYPARVMSNILFRVLGEYRDTHNAQRQPSQQQQQQEVQHPQYALPAPTSHNPHPHTHPPQHHVHQSIDMTDAGLPPPPAPAPPPPLPSATWATAASPGMMQPPPVPTGAGQTSSSVVSVSGSTDWTGLGGGGTGSSSNDTDLHGTILDGSTLAAAAGAGPSGFVDFEFDSGIWESIMNTLSQPLYLGV